MIIKKIAIIGFGRIGRASLKVILGPHCLEAVAENGLMSIENATNLFKYDSVYGVYGGDLNFKIKTK